MVQKALKQRGNQGSPNSKTKQKHANKSCLAGIWRLQTTQKEGKNKKKIKPRRQLSQDTSLMIDGSEKTTVGSNTRSGGPTEKERGGRERGERNGVFSATKHRGNYGRKGSGRGEGQPTTVKTQFNELKKKRLIPVSWGCQPPCTERASVPRGERKESKRGERKDQRFNIINITMKKYIRPGESKRVAPRIRAKIMPNSMENEKETQ